MKIIGISPGTRYVGYAVFYGSELRDWGVRNIGDRSSKGKTAKAVAFISSLMDQHGADVLSLKAIHPSRSSASLDRLVNRIADLSVSNGLAIHRYSIGELEGFFRPEEKMNRKALAEMVASLYPVLFCELDSEKALMDPYHIRMFEAVALGSICYNQFG